jgi:hypothetical protein
MKRVKGIKYRWLVILKNGKKKWFFSYDKLDKYCGHLDRNSKDYQVWDTEAIAL